MKRDRLLVTLADQVEARKRPHPVRVAIDGVDAAGKTTLADELATVLRGRGRTVIRASIDGFHRPRAARYFRGALSPEGYYRDSFDHDALASALLEPLGPGGSRRYRTAVFDFRSDRPVASETLLAPFDSVLLFDGVFLSRPELRACWDFVIFVAVTFETALARTCVRDVAPFGSVEAVRERYFARYRPGQRLYLEACRPEEGADVIVGNDDPDDASVALVESGDDR